MSSWEFLKKQRASTTRSVARRVRPVSPTNLSCFQWCLAKSRSTTYPLKYDHTGAADPDFTYFSQIEGVSCTFCWRYYWANDQLSLKSSHRVTAELRALPVATTIMIHTKP